MHDQVNWRRVILCLTEAADERLARLSAIHLEQFRAVHAALQQISIAWTARRGDASTKAEGTRRFGRFIDITSGFARSRP
jgi:hypothetical protein